MQDEPQATSDAIGPEASTSALFGAPLSGRYATLGLFTTQVE